VGASLPDGLQRRDFQFGILKSQHRGAR